MNQISEKEGLKKAQALCAKREYCKYDIRQKLYQWKVNSNYHNNILQKLEKDNFINENRYTELFVKDKFKLNRWGKIKIVYALKNKDISDVLINKYVDKIDEKEYIEICKLLIEHKIKSLANNENNKIKEKVLRFGQSRGFEMDLIYKLYDSITE